MLKALKTIMDYTAPVVLGALFFFSAWAKFDAIEFFEIQLVDFNLSTWGLSKYMSRVLISWEFFLGSLLLLRIRLKGFTYKASVITVLGFTAFVMYQIFIESGKDCGCFGQYIVLTPEQTLWKNIVTLAVLGVGMWSCSVKSFIPESIHKIGLILIPLTVLVTVVILKPPIDIYGQHSVKVVELGKPFPQNFSDNSIAEEWYEGEKLLVFVSAGCKYCKQVVAKMNVLYNKPEDKSRVLVVFAKIPQESIDSFFEATGGAFNYTRIEKDEFLQTTKGRFPQMFYLSNGNVKENIGQMEFFDQQVHF